MLPLNSPDVVVMFHLHRRTDLSTEIGNATNEMVRIVHRTEKSRGMPNSEAAYIPRACDRCSPELNRASGFRGQGERKESIRRAIKTRTESNQFENKNRVSDALLKTPNTVGMNPIKDFGWQRSIQAGEQVMACGAVGAARGYYAV